MKYLQENYSAVLFSYGAENEYATPAIKGENVFPSKELIKWYNSHPNYAGFGKRNIKNWKGLKTVTVVGWAKFT